MMQGAIGWPEGGFPKVLQKIILDSAGEKPIKGRPGRRWRGWISPRRARSWRADSHRAAGGGRAFVPAVPQVYADYSSTCRGTNTSVLPTPAFFYGLASGEEITVEIEPGRI